MEALCEIILTDITTLKERPFYIGILGLMWAGGSILAPVVGGLFAQFVTWRWIAWINLPLMSIALVLIPLFLTLTTDNSSIHSKLKRVDWIGISLLMTGMTAFILALCWGGQLFPWYSWQTLFPLIFGLVVLGILAIYERIPKEPIFNRRLFASRTSSIVFLGSFIQGVLIWILVYYLVLYFQGAIQHPPFQAAIDAFPLAFTLTPSAIVCALLIDKTRRYSWSVWFGWLCCTIGLGTMVLLDNNSSKAVYSILQLAPGIGTGFLLSGLAVPLQAAMSADDAGIAMGTQVFFRAVGALVGVSIGSAIFTNEFSHRLRMVTIPSDIVLPDSSDAVFFLTEIRTLPISVELRNEILQLYAYPIKVIWMTGACLAAVGLLSSIFIKELTLEREEVGRQAFQPFTESRSED
jgi:MFS family permease